MHCKQTIIGFNQTQWCILYLGARPRQTLSIGAQNIPTIKFFILFRNLLLRESPFHTVNCLKSFNFKLFFVYHITCWGIPLAHFHIIFALFWKTYDLLRSLLNVALIEWFISFLIKQYENYVWNLQRGSLGINEKGARRSPGSPPLRSNADQTYSFSSVYLFFTLSRFCERKNVSQGMFWPDANAVFF